VTADKPRVRALAIPFTRGRNYNRPLLSLERDHCGCYHGPESLCSVVERDSTTVLSAACCVRDEPDGVECGAHCRTRDLPNTDQGIDYYAWQPGEPVYRSGVQADA
jgi:hypothetical protein